MKNFSIRSAAFESGVRFWEVAEHLGVSEATLSRWLRRQLPPEEEAKILDAIKVIAEGRGVDG